jgi:hypothetical protein
MASWILLVKFSYKDLIVQYLFLQPTIKRKWRLNEKIGKFINEWWNQAHYIYLDVGINKQILGMKAMERQDHIVYWVV